MSDKTILITGGTGDLGHVVVPRLLRDYRCVVLYRTQSEWERLESDLGKPERLVGYPGLVADEASIRRGAERAAPLHGIVHMVGGFSPMATTDAFEQMLELNLMSAVRTIRGAIGEVSDGGRIVAISSNATVRPSGTAAYTVSKSALNAYIEVLAHELRPRRITANALLCGAMDTPQNRESMKGATLVPRESVADTIAYLLGETSANITGQLIAIGE